MKKKNRFKKKMHCSNMKPVVIVLVVSCLLSLTAAFYFGFNRKTERDSKILEFFPALAKYYTEECPVFDDDFFIDEDGKVVVPEKRLVRCNMLEYGVENDGAFYIDFEYSEVDKASGTLNDSTKKRMLFYKSDIDQDGIRGYARSVE